MKVALVYDRVNKWGGAERVILALKKIFPNAYLFTSVADFNKAPWAIENFKQIKTTFLQRIPLAKSRHELFASLMPIAFESLNFDGFDLVISVTSETAKGIITKPKTRHVCICLTPTRYLWSGYDFYFRNPILRNLSRPVVSYLRAWDKIASLRPDSYIAISREVQKRIKKYYGRESKVIYPPVFLRGPVASFPPASARSRLTDLRAVGIPSSVTTPKKFFLVVSRLVPYKRVDIAIKACNKLKLPLYIIGEGSQNVYLRLISGPTIKFIGKIPDYKLASYYRNSRALIFPGEEDFGLSMVEAQSMGVPVIAYKKAGALEIIKEGETGEFFDSQTPDSLASVLAKWDDKRYNKDLIIKNSQRFKLDNFKAEILKFINL